MSTLLIPSSSQHPYRCLPSLCRKTRTIYVSQHSGTFLKNRRKKSKGKFRETWKSGFRLSVRRKRPGCCPGPYKCSSESSEDGPSILEEAMHFLPRKPCSALPLIPSTKTSGRKGRKTTLREHLSCTRCFLIHYHSFSLHCAISSVFILPS